MPYKEEETFTEWKLDDPITAPYGKVPKLTEKPPEEKKEEITDIPEEPAAETTP